MVLVRAALVLIAWCVSLPAHAWSAQGHRITGHVANAHLTEVTRAQLRELVGTDDLARVATWMDDERDSLSQRIPDSPRWHYENRSVCVRTSKQNACPRGACVTRQIQEHIDILRNPRSNREQRAHAVRILAHLVGDLHQPLHLADNDDRGGNETFVRVPNEREPLRLHEVWDTTLIKLNMQKRGAHAYAQLLMRTHAANIESWRDGSLETWANETHDIGRKMAYAQLPGFACGGAPRRRAPRTLADEYLSEARTITERQLTRAGLRLARVLNSSFDER